MKDIFSKRQRFSLRKLTIGVCSVLLGTTIFATNAVAAEEVSATAAEATTTAAAPATTAEATTEAETTAAPAATEETTAAPEAAAETTAAPAATEETTAAPAAAEETTTAAPAAGETPRTRSRRAASQGSDNSPVDVETTLKDGETVTPDMSNPNGANVKSRDLADSSYKKADTGYTYHVLNLTKFNARYGVNYYVRTSKPFDSSTASKVELIDKNTGAVIETLNLSETSGLQTFTKTAQASNGELTLTVSYDKGIGKGPGKTDQPFLQYDYEVAERIKAYATTGTSEQRQYFLDIMNTRTSNDIFNAVEPAYDGRPITDTNAKIPVVVNNTTIYRVVDKSNPTYQAGRTETSTQSYKPNGNEEDLATYTMKAMEGQNFNASGVRQFDGYRLYQAADPTTTTGFVSRPYTVGTKFMDADRYGIKRIKEIVKEDGTAIVRVYLLDPKQQSKRSDGSLSTDGYILVAETDPIPPGEHNKTPLAKSNLNLTTIPYPGHPNGENVTATIQMNAPYTPYKTLFVPFLGDKIGHGSDNDLLEKGGKGIGTNVDLLNTLVPFKQPIYYYEKIEPVKVKPEFKKTLEGRNLVDGEFSFTIKEQKSSPDGHEETVQNADGKVSFSELTFNKPGTYKYKITEKAGSDANVDYDAMEITMTVEVTQDAAGVLKTKVTYSAEGGETSKADDQEFNNFVVPPVSTKFDFTKKLEGRPLKDKEFSFVLKDAEGNEIETVKNDADGNVTFTALNYDKTKVGVHKYTVEEVIPATKEDRMDYDTMKANITVTVSKSGHVLTTVTTYASEGGNATGADDKEFNNKVTPPPTTPEFKPEKFVVNKEKFDITGDKLMDDDNELTDEVAETNANPYADKSTNNEAENINGKTLKKGDKFYYQVWLDTTKFTADQNIQYVGITDDYEEDKLDVTTDGIKVYDSVSGADVTSKFDIKVEDGKISATSKAEFVNENSVIDTTKFEFGRYYKFDIAATIKTTVKDGIDIENTASQIVHVYDPYNNTVEKPEKPTQKRVVNIPVSVDFNFTKKLEGRTLKDQEFTFVLKDAKGTEIETVKNDKDGNVKFKSLEFTKDQVGTHKYTIEEVAGTDATVTYDKMKAEVTVKVSYDGTAKALIKNVTDAPDKEFNNTVTPPTTPEFQPEKFIVTKEKFDVTGDKLMDDDNELTDEYAETNANPYADGTDNNEAENLNTKTVKRGDKVVYQVWLDTNNFTAAQNIQSVGITDNYDEAKLTVDKANIKAYDSKTGAEVTNLFDITVENGVITATSKASLQKSLGDAENTQVLDTTKFAFGRYYKFDIVATVKEDVTPGADIENTAVQVVNQYDPTSKTVKTPEKPTQKRVVNIPVEVEFNFTKKLQGRELKDQEFSFVLKDAEGTEIETVKNDKDGNVKFKALAFNKNQAGTYKYTIEEVAGSDATVTYDKMKAEVTVEVKYDGTAKALITKLTDAPDKEFNNVVTPPNAPNFKPEKFILTKEKYDITGDKLMNDDDELTDEVADTNANPYADKTTNNEAENLNTKTVKRGSKVVYQVWLDTNNFTAAQNIQSVGITDDYDEAKLTVDAANVKAYDSKTGKEVTDLFDITVEDGVIKATSKASLQKSLGDAEDTQVLDTTKFAFGRYYKFDIVATVKEDVKGGADIENTATQIVHQYDPTSKSVVTPEKPTQKRVINVPIEVEFNFTKKLEGRELKDQEFSFVLKDAEGTEIETVKNDKDGNVKFKAIEYNKNQAGTYKYTIEEVAGTDGTVTYDKMKAEVTVEVKYDGTAKALITKVTDAEDKEFNNTVTPPGTPEFQPKKFVVKDEKFDITGDKLVDDDKELTDAVTETNANPYADTTDNNEAENLNTKTVKRGEKLVYQVWLDTNNFTEKQNIQSVGITDDFDEAKLTVEAANVKAYDSKTGEDVTDKFDITVEDGVIKATSKSSLTKSLGDAEDTQVIDTEKFAFGRYYKFDIVATVKEDVAGGSQIENTATQIVHQYDPTSKTVKTPEKPTEKRVNQVPIEVEFDFTKKLEGRELAAGEFSFVLKDAEGTEIETVKNDKDGKIKFSKIEFKKGDEGTHKYTVEEVAGTDATVTYDTMKAEITVEVSYDGTAKILVTKVTDAADKEFNNTVTPPETPEFQPKKFVVKDEKFDTTGNKLVDDDAELTDAVTDTKADPYADKADNNEAENINTSTLKKGDKVVYQVWLDTTKFDANNKDYIQSVGITDNYDEENLTVDVANIKAYDSVTGEDVTAKFDIKVENGVITATSKADLTKSLGDAEDTKVLDTTKFAFGRYYKFDIVATIKETAKDGVDIENTASQTVHQYDPTKKSVEKPEKPTETRVVNIPTKVEFEFTKRLEGRPLKDGEFSFVLKDKDGNVIETVTNDADGKIKFSALTFKRGEEGVYTYTVEEVKGTEEGVTYDTMVATVTVTVAKDGKVLTAVAGLPEDTEFNNTVTPPNTPNTPPQTPPTPGKPELPKTGVEDLSAVFNAASVSLLAGLGLLATGKKKEDEEE
ncbi:SspB-related isopeptide-forming adhesin [Granulicatella sp. UMB5615A]|uniref:SspB-related isopeptide-forming adhesin n=2 Tax=unclassified Granulicatella TaxID=2630493 RepID=UPI002552BF20|nr:SspB-related isopeptide-forming adhesin [Granulicatella sp. UMB5615A]MDK8523245.1 FctA domain-containing protein [Granulicatella sp. UMB5615A]